MKTELKNLIGRKITKIFLNEYYLKFETDKGPLVYGVWGDCCSNSYFFDFYGVKKLLENGPVTDVKCVELKDGERTRKCKKDGDEYIQYYGYQIFTENDKLGEQTAVFSFRNASNGFYGGEINEVNDQEVLPEINDDIIEVE